ncbi:MAG: hypothetical protein LQ352_008186 [Teloschistes flavicans]|nr:MAG: hypothetical protein LQ352_008186 [Teloschistes flavicans]
MPGLEYNCLIELSIVSVAEMLVSATDQAYGIEDIRKDNECPLHWVFPELETSLEWKRHGFCPSEINRIGKTFFTVQTRHFLRWMRKPDQLMCHDHCTEYECRASHNNTKQYATKHVENTCRCTNYLVKVSDIVEILSNGSLPLLKITQGTSLNDIKIAVIQATPGSDYIAYSHVWSDGLGNPYANSLPKCQIKRLHDLTRQFVPDSGKDESTQGLPIWIDTLCCPVEPTAAKNMALHNMKVPYTEATHVLVLDSSLEHVGSSELHLTEIGLRIFTTGWMRRLWTLQEGALPRKLWFQFKDKAVDLDPVEEGAIECFNHDIGRQGLSIDILRAYQSLRGFFYRWGDEAPDLVNVHESLQFRSVSFATDEPLLVGGLLNLDLGYILDGDELSRMQRLFTTASRIPCGFLFHSWSRMSQRGFRWAPVSLMGPVADSIWTDSSYPKGTVTVDGLRVSLPALPIRIPTLPRRFPHNYFDVIFKKTNEVAYARYGNGTWFLLSRRNNDISELPIRREILRGNTDRYTLLLDSAFSFTGALERKDALLVHYGGSGSVAGHVISDTVLKVATMPDILGALLEASYQTSQRLLASDFTAERLALAIDDDTTLEINPLGQQWLSSFRQTMRSILETTEDPRVLNAIQFYGRQKALNLYKYYIITTYLGRFFEFGEMMPDDTEWCVD